MWMEANAAVWQKTSGRAEFFVRKDLCFCESMTFFLRCTSARVFDDVHVPRGVTVHSNAPHFGCITKKT